MSEHDNQTVAASDDGVIDLETLAKNGQPVPPFTHVTRYRIRIDKVKKVVDVPNMTGAQILSLVDKLPKDYRLDLKLHGGATEKIEPNQTVDFTRPGVEKFMTLPLDQTDGSSLAAVGDEHAMTAPVKTASTTPTAMPARRQFDLPEDDAAWLDANGLRWESVVVKEGGAEALWLFLHAYPIPAGYAVTTPSGLVTVEQSLVGVRVTGYPGGDLDMVYFHPPLQRLDSKAIHSVSDLSVDGKPFQQWSRHYTSANPFRRGVDNIGTHLALMEEWLRRELAR